MRHILIHKWNIFKYNYKVFSFAYLFKVSDKYPIPSFPISVYLIII